MQFTTLLLLPALVAGLAIRQNNAQTFNGALAGIAATPIEDSGNPDRPFSVKGDTFVNLAAAVQRSCDQQFNACANLANGQGGGNGGDVAFADCTAQKSEFSSDVRWDERD